MACECGGAIESQAQRHGKGENEEEDEGTNTYRGRQPYRCTDRQCVAPPCGGPCLIPPDNGDERQCVQRGKGTSFGFANMWPR